ncbi:rna pseudouridine synthase superfamily protein, partial [Cystoisospora suis]
MGNGVSSPPGGVGPGGTTSSSLPGRHAPPFPSPSIPSSSGSFSSSRISRGARGDNCRSSKPVSASTFSSSAETSSTCSPMQKSCFALALPPLPATFSDSALLPPPASTRSEPPYISPWPPSSPSDGSLSPAPSSPLQHPLSSPSRRASATSTCGGSVPPPHYYGVGVPNSAGGVVVGESRRQFSSQISSYSPCPAHAMGAYGVTGASWGLGLEPGRGGVMPPPSHHQREILGSVSDEETGAVSSPSSSNSTASRAVHSRFPSRAMMFPASCASGTVEETAGVELETEGDARSQTDGICGGEGYDGDDDVRAANKWNDMAAAMKQGDMNFRSVSGHPDLSLPAKAPVNTFFFHSGRMGARQRSLSDDECHIHHASLSAFRNMPAAHNDLRAILTAGGPAPGGAFLPCSQTAFADQLFVLPPSSSLTVNSETPKKDSSPPCQQERDCRDRGTCSHSRGSAWASSATGVATNSSGRGQGGGGGVDGNRKGAAGEGVSSGSVVVRGRSGFPDPTKQSTNPLWFGSTSGMAEGQPATRGSVQRTCRGRGRSATGVVGADAEQFFTSQHMRGRLAHHRSHIVSEVCSERGVAPSVSCGTPPIVTGHPALSAARGGDCSHGISRSSNGSGGGSGSGHRKMGPVSSLQQGHGASGGFPRSDRTGFVDDATKGGISRSSVDTETTTSGVPSSFVGSRGPGRLTNCEGQYSGVVPPFDDTLTCKLDGGPNNNAAPQAFCYTCCARGHVTPLGYPCVAHPRSGMSAGVGLLSGNVVEAASSSARGDLPKQHTSLDPLSGALAQNPSLSSSSLAHPSLTCFSDCSCSNLLLRGGAADVAATPGSAGTRLLVSGGGGGPGPDALVGATEAECRTGLLRNVKIDFPSSSNLPLLGRQKHSTNPKNSGRKKPHHDQHGDIGPRSDNEEGCCPQQNVAPLRSGQESPFTQHTSESEELDETSFACCGSERCLHQSSGIGHGHHPSMPVGHHTVQQGGVLQNGCVSSERGRSPSGSCGVSALESSTAISPCSKTVGCKGVGGGGGGRGSNTAGLKAGDTFLSSSYGDSNHARGSGSHAKGKAASSTSSSSGSRGVGKQGTVADMTDMRDSMENSNDERLRQFSGTGGAAGQRKVPRGEYSVPRGCRSPSGTLGTGAAGAAAMKNILGSGPMNSTCRESTTNNFSTSAAVGDGGEGSSPSGSGSNISGGSGKSCNDSLPGDGNNNNKSGGGTGGGDGGKKGSGGGSGNGSGGNGGGGLSGGSSSSRNRNSGNTKDCQTVDFYVRNFWKVAKTQNDLESPTHGYCRGFAYRLLLHPRGTTGTDSEASHLSVFLEAIRQDWYPDDWIFPNVRFELTVVNFKDPKQSVTSWAHWSFSNEATSRGWQKMISHARLNKQAGFMDEEGTVLVKGKAEPPFSSLWSRGPVYRPHRIWEYIPERAAKALEEVSSSCSAAALALTGGNGGGGINTTNNASNATSAGGSNGGAGAGNALAMQRIKTPTASLLSYVDPIVPALDSSLGADYVALFVHCLFHLCEFRKHIYMWKSDFIKSPTAEQLAQDSSLAAQIPSFADGSLIGALQQTFAYMQLWPVTIACKRLQQLTASSSSSARKEICPSEIWKWYGAELFPKNSPSRRAPPPAATSPTNSRVAFCTLCRRCTCCCRCRSTAYHATAASGSHGFAGQTHLAVGGGVDGRCGEDGSGGRAGGGRAGAGGSSAGTSSTGEDVDMIYKQLKLDRDTCLCCDLMDRYPEMMVDMPPQPNIKAVLKALHMHDVQKMDVPDPLVKVHTELFSLLMRELAKAKLETRQMQQDYQTARHVVTASVVGSDGTSYIPEPTDGSGESENGGGGGGVPGQGPDAGGGLWADVDGVAFTSCDHLEATCHELFSSSDRSTGLLNADGVPDISAGFTRCKHVHSLQKALESCGKVLQHFPEVLFVYLQSVKQCKKGELFDAPLRLDAHKLLQTKSRTPSSSPGGGEGGNNGGNENNTKQNIGGGPSTADREKQRRRLRKKLQLSRKGNKLSREPQEEDSDLTEDEELAVSDEEDSTYDHGEDGHSKAGSKGHANGGTNTGGDNGKGGVAVPGGPNGSGHSSSSSSMSGGMATPNQEKWFSLFALLIREGDSRGDGCGAQTSHYLLLRPEEDGPWFRIGDGRVERLSSKVDFTEWKCHRDFFCAGAVYIAEDYIDAVQAGDVDLSGDLRELNPWLYYRTLYELGITEAEIKRPWISNMNANAASHSPSASGSLSNLCPPVSGGDGAVPRSVSDVTGQVVQPQGVSGIPGTSSAPRASTGGGGMAFDRLTGEVAGGLNASKLGYAGGAGGK